LVNSNGKDEDISGYEGSKRYPIRPAVTLVPSQPSQPSLPNPSNEDTFYSCYHKGCDFQTQDEYEYKRHGAAKHVKNPLLYPSKAKLNKYSLQAQGKSWEI